MLFHRRFFFSPNLHIISKPLEAKIIVFPSMGFKKQIIFNVSFANHADVLMLMGELDFQHERTSNYKLVMSFICSHLMIFNWF